MYTELLYTVLLVEVGEGWMWKYYMDSLRLFLMAYTWDTREACNTTTVFTTAVWNAKYTQATCNYELPTCQEPFFKILDPPLQSIGSGILILASFSSPHSPFNIVMTQVHTVSAYYRITCLLQQHERCNSFCTVHTTTSISHI